MKKLFALLFFAVTCTVTVNGQDLGYLLAGPSAEYYFRRIYAPADFALGLTGQYAGYGRTGRSAAIAAGAMTGMAAGAGIGAMAGQNTRSALIGAGVGAAAGGLLTYAATRGGQPAYNRPVYTVDGREAVFVAPKSQKPLDCRKPRGKRGKNEAACAAAEAEAAAVARQEAERQALTASPWRLYNRSGFIVEVFDDEQTLGRMRVNQSWRVLEPTAGFRAMILAPDFSGAISEHEAWIRPANDFQGWVITSPKVEEE